MQKSFVVRIIPFAAIAFVLAVVAALAYPSIMERLQTNSLRATFKEESAQLKPALKELGVDGELEEYLQCSDTNRSRFSTTTTCTNFYIYPHNATAMSEPDKQTFPQKAAAFDKLLREQRWKVNRPDDGPTTLAASNPFLPENGGKGGSVPFQKRIHGVSCDLKIDIDSTAEGHNPGALNVVQFSCDKDFSYPVLNWRTSNTIQP